LRKGILEVGPNGKKQFSMLGIGIVRGSRAGQGTVARRATLAAAAVLGMALLAGCGGGSGSNGNNGGAGRAAAVTAVRGARGASTHLAGNPVGGLGQEGAALSRKVNGVLRLRKASVTRQVGVTDVSFDEDYGLWTKLDDTAPDNKIKILYFRNQAATQSAGFFEMTFQGNPEQYPLNIAINFDITAGKEPGHGTATINMTSETAGTFVGSFTDRQTGETVTFELVLGENGMSNGAFSLTEDGVTYQFRNVVLNENGALNAEILAPGMTGNLVVNGDESGTLTLNIAEGVLMADWNAEGSGTIRFPNGSVQTIADFDSAQ
jgi:hypothetical protein